MESTKTRPLIKPSYIAAVSAGVVVIGVASLMQAGRAQEPATSPEAQSQQTSSVRQVAFSEGQPSRVVSPAPGVTLDLRDADIRHVYKMLFDGYKQDYSLAPEVNGEVTAKFTNQKFEDSLKFIARSSQAPLKVDNQNDIWIVKSYGPINAKKPQQPVLAIETDDVTSVKDVPRRVSAVLLLDSSDQAILINGPESSAEAQTRIVKVGDTVPAGITGQEPLAVTKIDITGIELTQTGGERASFRVPLAAQVRAQPAEKY